MIATSVMDLRCKGYGTMYKMPEYLWALAAIVFGVVGCNCGWLFGFGVVGLHCWLVAVGAVAVEVLLATSVA